MISKNTYRDTILTAVVDAMKGTTPAGKRVYRSRITPINVAQYPAIVVTHGAEEVLNYATGLTRRALDIRIEVQAVATSKQSADQMADPVLQAIHAQIMSDPTLGGALMRIAEIGIEAPEYHEAADTVVGITAVYRAEYLTKTGDLTQVAI